MTADPEQINSAEPINKERKVENASEMSLLESMFYLGYAQSPVIEIYNDGTVELKAKFRTLTPLEIRDVMEERENFTSAIAQAITERIELLARAIVTINHMPLVLTKEEQGKFFEDNKRQPSPLEMARHILRFKIRSMVVIDALYEKYLEFSNKVMTEFEDAKKKLKS